YKATLKPPQGHPKATTKPFTRQEKAIPKPPTTLIRAVGSGFAGVGSSALETQTHRMRPKAALAASVCCRWGLWCSHACFDCWLRLRGHAARGGTGQAGPRGLWPAPEHGSRG